MGEEKLLFLLLIGLAALVMVPFGILMICTDLSGMFCYYKAGGIYLVRFDRRMADDTPKNRRALSRKGGFFFLGVVCAAVVFLLGALF